MGGVLFAIMAAERIQRRIERLLDLAEEAADQGEWAVAANYAREILAFSPGHEDAVAMAAAADRMLGSSPAPIPGRGSPAASTRRAENVPESFAGGRYRVTKFLGEGGKKRVFLAHDALLDRDVAFSLIKTEGLDDIGRERILREAQAMGRLTHPQVVAVFDMGEQAGPDGTMQPYLVQELMGGGDVEGLIEEAGGALPLKQTLRIAIEVCKGLEYAHSQGVIHRDLKPGNVWLTADGAAKIGDFGLAVSLDRSRLTQHGMMVGTVAYMPPEQALGGDVSPQSDLYSIGAMLYEMVTGQPPFAGDNPTAIISQHIKTPPVAPSYRSDHCPADLERLILRLLAKAPADRPASAREVRETLERVDPAAPSPSHSDSASSPLDRLPRGVFVGREHELDRLRAAFDEAFAGRGSVAVMAGEPGIGKTRTTQELETYVRMRGGYVFWGRAYESAGAPALYPWIQVGNAWGASVDVLGAGATALAQLPVRGELVRLFPDLRELPRFANAETADDPEEAQFRLFDAYAQFMRNQSRERPWLVVLDDLHWADKPTLRLLQFVARELSTMRVMVVGTYRDTELSRSHPLAEALAELNREAGFLRLSLRGLSEAEVGRYMAEVAGREPSRALVHSTFEETEGNPFFLSEVVNLMAEEGTLAADSVAEVKLPEGVKEALGRRLDRLSEGANDLLALAAVVGREFAYDTLRLVGDRGDDELVLLIEEGLRARVIEETDRPGRYRFTHALMQETLLDELSATRRVRLHGLIGEALEHQWQGRADERAARLAHHFAESATLAAEHRAKAVHYLVAAGRQAAERFAWNEATGLFERALAFMGDQPGDDCGENRGEVLRSLGEAAANGGEYRSSWRALMQATEAYEAAGNARGLAQAALIADVGWAPTARVVTIYERALERLGDAEPELRARILSRLIDPLLIEGTTPAQKDAWADALAQLHTEMGAPEPHTAIHKFHAGRLAEQGRFAEALNLLQERVFVPMGAAAADEIRSIEVNYAVASGNLAEAYRLSEIWAETGHRLQNRFDRENAPAAVAALHLLRGDFERFDLESARAADAATYLWNFLCAYAATVRGDPEGALRLLPKGDMVTGITYQELHVRAIRAITLWRLGRRDDAAAAWANADGLTEQINLPTHMMVLAFLDEAGPQIGGPPLEKWVRERILAPESAWRTCRGMVWAPSCLSRTIGNWARSFGMIDDAIQIYQDSLAWCQENDCGVEAGRCLLALAEMEDERGNHPQALEYLDEAGALLARHGASYFLDQVIARKEILKA
jgi:tetratricopeptide (TPR) repeat protein